MVALGDHFLVKVKVVVFREKFYLPIALASLAASLVLEEFSLLLPLSTYYYCYYYINIVDYKL